MKRRVILCTLISLCVVAAPLAAFNSYSGDYSSNLTIDTSFNSVPVNQTLHITGKAVCTLKTDLIVKGSLVVDKNASFVAAADKSGYLKFERGSNMSGIDLYYSIQAGTDVVITRKIPMSVSDIWNSGNRDTIEYFENMEFCWDASRKGWIQTNEPRFGNPFNENLFDQYDAVWITNASEVLIPGYRSITVKSGATLTVLDNPQSRDSRIEQFIKIEPNAAIKGRQNGHKLALKQGVTVEGMSVYAEFDHHFVDVQPFLADIWKEKVFGEDEYINIIWNNTLRAWVFEWGFGPNETSKELAEKIMALIQ